MTEIVRVEFNSAVPRNKGETDIFVDQYQSQYADLSGNSFVPRLSATISVCKTVKSNWVFSERQASQTCMIMYFF